VLGSFSESWVPFYAPCRSRDVSCPGWMVQENWKPILLLLLLILLLSRVRESRGLLSPVWAVQEDKIFYHDSLYESVYSNQRLSSQNTEWFRKWDCQSPVRLLANRCDIPTLPSSTPTSQLCRTGEVGVTFFFPFSSTNQSIPSERVRIFYHNVTPNSSGGIYSADECDSRKSYHSRE